MPNSKHTTDVEHLADVTIGAVHATKKALSTARQANLLEGPEEQQPKHLIAQSDARWVPALGRMQCLSPQRGYRDSGGRVSFSRIALMADPTKIINVSCGQCINCRLERARQWAVRIMHEAHEHEANSFITLTYSNNNLPFDEGLDVEHFKLFAKRLRKRIGKFRYYHCGEYGEKTYRPHYHVCLFGSDFTFDRKLHQHTKDGHSLYTSPTLDASWKLGHALIGDLTFESAAYVAGYVTKKITGEKATQHYEICDPITGEVHDRRPDYSTMSRRPGIGASWFKKFATDVYPRDEIIFQGRAMRPPRYYDRQLEIANPEQFKEVQQQRTAKALADQKPEDTNLRRRQKIRYAEKVHAATKERQIDDNHK